jgi:hypothetical protein
MSAQCFAFVALSMLNLVGVDNVCCKWDHHVGIQFLGASCGAFGGLTLFHDIPRCTVSMVRATQQAFPFTDKACLLFDFRIMLAEGIADAQHEVLCPTFIMASSCHDNSLSMTWVLSDNKGREINAWTKPMLETPWRQAHKTSHVSHGLHSDSVNAHFVQRLTTQTSSLDGDLKTQTARQNHTRSNLLAPLTTKQIKMPNFVKRIWSKVRPAREDPETAIKEFLAAPIVNVAVPARKVSQSSKASRRSWFSRSRTPPWEHVPQPEPIPESAAPKMERPKHNWPALVELLADTPLTRHSMIETPDDYFKYRTDMPAQAAPPSQAARPKSFDVDSTCALFAEAKPQYEAFPDKSPAVSPPAQFQPYPGGRPKWEPVPVSGPYVPQSLTPGYFNGVPGVLLVANQPEQAQPRPTQAHEKKLSYPLIDIGSELFTNADVSKESSSRHASPGFRLCCFGQNGFVSKLPPFGRESLR